MDRKVWKGGGGVVYIFDYPAIRSPGHVLGGGDLLGREKRCKSREKARKEF
jgi:hypothetical protein